MDDNQRADDRPGQAAPPLDELCGLVLEQHHAYVHGAIPVIRGWLSTLDAQDSVVPLLIEVRTAFADLADQLAGHLAKEENILFPALAAMAQADREGRGRPELPFPTVLHPIRMMESEHAQIERAVTRLREITHGYTPPEGVSEAWQRGFRELARLDKELEAHLHAENDILFPRALELERHLL